MDFELVTDDAGGLWGIEAREFSPIESGKIGADRFAFGGIGLQANQSGDGVVEIEDAAFFVDDEKTVLDGVEESLEKSAFAGEALDDGLEAFGVEAPDTAKDLV